VRWSVRRDGVRPRPRVRPLVVGALAAVVAVLAAAVVVLEAGPSGADPAASGGAGTERGPAAGPPEPAIAGDAAVSAPAPTGAPLQAPLPTGPVGREVVRSAQLTVEVGDVVEAARSVRTAVAAVDGFVAAEQSDDTGAYFVLRVPAGALDRLIDDVAALGGTVARGGRVEDVTEQVVDLDARVASQQASVARVRALLAEASTIADVVAIEAELARREAELDSLVSRLEYLREQVALSTLTVDLRGPDAADDDEVPPGFAGGLAAGWDGLRALGGASAAVVGFVLPFVPVLGVLALLGWGIRRRALRPAAAVPGGPGAPGSS